MPIQRSNPTIEPERVYDQWFLSRLEVYPDPNAVWRVSTEFRSMRDSGQPLLDENGTQQLDPTGEPRTILELHPSEKAVHIVPDLVELARTKAAAGDPRYVQAIGLILEIVAESARAAGDID